MQKIFAPFLHIFAPGQNREKILSTGVKRPPGAPRQPPGVRLARQACQDTNFVQKSVKNAVYQAGIKFKTVCKMQKNARFPATKKCQKFRGKVAHTGGTFGKNPQNFARSSSRQNATY